MKTRAHHGEEKGFILLGVIVIIAIITATVTLTLRQSTDGLQQAGGLRSAELTSTALEHGLDRALAQLQNTDVASLLTPPMNGTRSAWDIFDVENSGPGWLTAGRLPYPASGPYQNEIQVRVGLRMGQTTQAPPGENAVNGYGYVVELQLSAEMVGIGQAAEQQVAIGVQVPQANSYAK